MGIGENCRQGRYDRTAIIRAVVSAGFSCSRCGACCRDDGADLHRVMVGSHELRAVVAHAGLPPDECATPYPDYIEAAGGVRCRFNWALRTRDGGCRFLGDEGCMVYPARPWICRTYPFQLDEDGVHADPSCPGLGSLISKADAAILADDLIRRYLAEEDEAALIRAHLGSGQLPSRGTVVIDADGIRVIDG